MCRHTAKFQPMRCLSLSAAWEACRVALKGEDHPLSSTSLDLASGALVVIRYYKRNDECWVLSSRKYKHTFLCSPIIAEVLYSTQFIFFCTSKQEIPLLWIHFWTSSWCLLGIIAKMFMSRHKTWTLECAGLKIWHPCYTSLELGSSPTHRKVMWSGRVSSFYWQ